MVTVFVQTVPGRVAWEESRQSLEASDVGTAYHVLTQPPATPPRQHFLDVLTAMSVCGTEWALRLEDDVLVNRHILANIASWAAKEDPLFGVGWLFDAGGTTRTVHDRMYGRVGKDRWHAGELHCCQAVLLRTSFIPELIPRCAEWFEHHPGVLAQDIALSRAVAAAGRRICVHAPPLVEHMIHHVSTLGHANTRSHTTEGAFNQDWQR